MGQFHCTYWVGGVLIWTRGGEAAAALWGAHWASKPFSMFFAIVGFLLHRQWRPPGMSRLAIVSYSPFFFFFFSFSNDFPNFIIKQQMGTIWNYLFDGWLHFSKTSTSMAKNIIPDPWSKLSKLFTESEDEPGRYESRDSNQLLGPRDSSSRAFVSISVQNWSSGFNHRA